ncbi:phosphate ABC transporter substrate-binding protein PstS [Mumia sp.]|uniref:phosphate ABC transporter substrate-binding protein PstS n=1 Tax=Mumia sp. TaxID=1965300 RepID=UPI00260C8B05|nr:phosphate ABC transporter substrate-binding protein PstS [Mumia sp.]MDD9347940.1 phosphate ABC transporter substrate-binding protein PstS [Mumia sp.]
MNRTKLRAAAPLALAATVALGLSACGAGNEAGADDSATTSELSGTLNGAGASSQEAAVASWKQGFQTANPDVTVNYDPAGSGAGREQFLAGGTDFAGSDAYLDDEELAAAEKRCSSDVVEVPTYVSPIAVIYNLPGVDGLKLSPDTLGKIFAGTVTTWDDAAIKADNPDADLPSSTITPVHRSDDSGTTENFTAYLAAAGPQGWTAGEVETWPLKGGEGAQGTSGVVAAVQGGEGTIGYADASQAGDLGVASLKVGEEYVGPSPEAAAKVLEASKQKEGRGDTHIVMDIDHTTTESGVYPAVLLSYQIACLEYDDEAKADLVKGWLSYVASSDGQKAAAEGAGSAPLTSALEERITGIVDGISAK